MIRTILNILWFLLGGLWMAIGWYFSGIIMILTIIGIPWARACFVIGTFTLWPFGREMRNREEVTGEHDIGTGMLGLVGNVIWFLFGGIWLAIGHIVAAALNAITIIGIPFAWQHIKLAGLCLAPVGKIVVEIPQYNGFGANGR